MKKWLILLIIGIVLLLLGYNYIYKDHRNIAEEKASFITNCEDLINEFSKNPSSSEIKYNNKTIELTGTITQLNQNNLTLNGKVFCQFNNNIAELLSVNTQIKIKGRFLGYDDLLEEIKLDQCTIN